MSTQNFSHRKLLLLVSGELGLHCLKFLKENFYISAVMTDKSSEKIIAYCIGESIPFWIGNPNSEDSKNALSFISQRNIDILFSINYIFLLQKKFLDSLGVIPLNVHGSLLPKYRGRTPHVWAIINGEERVGVTIHKIDAGCDTGPVLLQREIVLSPEDTGGTVLNKFFIVYPELISEALELVFNGRALFNPQKEEDASFFSKREPKDGRIIWNWTFKRLNNWVRAQTKPYPGAYCYNQSQDKIIIWKVDFVAGGEGLETGSITRNGSEFMVKIADGLAVLTDWESNVSSPLIEGERLL